MKARLLDQQRVLWEEAEPKSEDVREDVREDFGGLLFCETFVSWIKRFSWQVPQSPPTAAASSSAVVAGHEWPRGVVCFMFPFLYLNTSKEHAFEPGVLFASVSVQKNPQRTPIGCNFWYIEASTCTSCPHLIRGPSKPSNGS